MPFTFSHPAIVLPLTVLPKRWISSTGLIVGSMTPDFEYFLRMRIKSDFSHTLDGLFWFDLPLGLALTFIFHNIVRNSLLDNLPHFLKIRFSTFTTFNWNMHVRVHWYVVLFSLFLGSASHVLWDGFTHLSGYFFDSMPVLTGSVDLLGQSIPGYKVLQHVSTVIGALVIALYVYWIPIDSLKKNSINMKYWTVFAILTLIVLLVRFIGGIELADYGNVIVSGISACLLSLILTPIVLSKKRDVKCQ